MVVPSRYEPFGIVILEGMLRGLAIAAAAVGGPLDILEHHRTGLLFPPRDPDALAGAVVQLAKDPGLRATLGSAAAREVRRRWLWPTIVARLQVVYEEALPDRRPDDVRVVASAVQAPGSTQVDGGSSFPFLVGHARSGTTLLRALLDSHSQLAIPWESYFVTSLFPRYFDVNATTFKPAVFLKDLFATPFGRWGIPAAQIRSAIDAAPITGYAELIRRIYACFAHSRGKARYGDKTPGYTRDIGLLSHLLPEARFIHIIRDGRDVATSLQQVAWGVKNTYDAARSWARHVGEGMAAGQRLGPHRYMEIRYEELVRAPERTMAEVCQFIGLRFEAGMLHYFERAAEIIAPDPWPQFHHNLFAPITSGLRDWRRDLSARDVAVFEAVSGELLAELGYELAFTRRRAGTPSPA
jgi:sulfotransferase family protein/glycosyl transferase family 1